MSKKDKWAKIITWFPSRGMRKRRRSKTLFTSKRRRKPDSKSNSKNRMNKRNCRTTIEWSKKIKWKIKLVSNPRDLLKWKLRRRGEENKWEQDGIMRTDAMEKSSSEI
jgi:hypothetical protein